MVGQPGPNNVALKRPLIGDTQLGSIDLHPMQTRLGAGRSTHERVLDNRLAGHILDGSEQRNIHDLAVFAEEGIELLDVEVSGKLDSDLAVGVSTGQILKEGRSLDKEGTDLLEVEPHVVTLADQMLLASGLDLLEGLLGCIRAWAHV